MARVKICGLSDLAGIDAAVGDGPIGTGADWIGLVFVPSSPRVVDPAQAALLAQQVAGRAKIVGLFVKPTDADVDAVLQAVPLDILQVYGSCALAGGLRDRFGLPVWHAFGVSTPADLPADPARVDGYLLDAKPPESSSLLGGSLPGGNAVSFDWAITRGWQAPLPWLLAGGLHPGNVADAIRTSGADAVDVSSGVERSRGVKDPALIRAFVQAAKAA